MPQLEHTQESTEGLHLFLSTCYAEAAEQCVSRVYRIAGLQQQQVKETRST